jgi:ribosome-associated protein YbcJ (S4-like RNA binding protein)
VDGEGAIDGEGAEEGEGAIEGEGAVDGEPEGEGEGTVDGEPEGEGEGFVEEGEGEDISPAVIQLLQDFSNGDLNHDGFLSLEELLAIAGENILDILDLLDANGDDLVQVSELLHIVGPIWIHNADINGDHVISLGDLLRAVQLFNQGGYSCADNAGATEDGFVATGAGVPCVRHAADYSNGEDGDGAISLQELLRLIQLYNAGGYAYCPGQQPVEDGFCIEAL